MAHPIFALGLPHGSEWIFIALIILLMPATLAVIALISCLKNETSTERLVWTLVIVFFHFFGPIIYLLVRRPQRMRELGH